MGQVAFQRPSKWEESPVCSQNNSCSFNKMCQHQSVTKVESYQCTLGWVQTNQAGGRTKGIFDPGLMSDDIILVRVGR